MSLNKGAHKIFEEIVERSKELESGIDVPGSNEAGRLVSEICLGGAGEVSLTEVTIGDITLPAVSVKTDKVTEACLCSQYAGWTIQVDNYFAMASGPARALARVEKLYKELGYTEESNQVYRRQVWNSNFGIICCCCSHSVLGRISSNLSENR